MPPLDLAFVVSADPERVLAVLDGTPGPRARFVAAVYRASAETHRGMSADLRRQVLAMDAARSGDPALAAGFAAVDLPGRPSPAWTVAWASGSLLDHRLLHVLTGHGGRVLTVATAVADGRPVAVTGSSDTTVRVWDLATAGQIHPPLYGDTDPVSAITAEAVALCTTVVEGRPVAVAASSDGRVPVVDLITGTHLRGHLPGHKDGVISVAAAVLEGRPVAVTAGWDGTLRVWDLRTGRKAGESGMEHPVRIGAPQAVATATVDGAPVVLTAGGDGTLRIWSLESAGPPVTGSVRTSFTKVGLRPLDRLAGHEGPVLAVASLVVGGRPVAVTAGADRTVRVWDLEAGRQVGGPLTGHTDRVWSVATATVDGRPVAVTAGADHTVRVWDLAGEDGAGAGHAGHTGQILAIATMIVGGRAVAVTGGADRTVRVWDLATGRPSGPPVIGFTEEVAILAAAVLGGRPVAVTVDADSAVSTWDLLDGRRTGRAPAGHTGRVLAVATAVVGGRAVAVTGG
ncbi:WD40 repeat domain-containing protein, partial [Planomonospora algeriensis]